MPITGKLLHPLAGVEQASAIGSKPSGVTMLKEGGA
jgi:hypothetical protein